MAALSFNLLPADALSLQDLVTLDSVSATLQSVAGIISSTDQESSIPWMDDLGVPQSGGKHPFHLVKRIPFTQFRPVTGLVAMGEDGVFVIYEKPNLHGVNGSGQFIWELAMTDLGESRYATAYPLAGAKGVFYLVGQPTIPGGAWPVVAVNSEGKILRRMSWDGPFPENVRHISYHEGFLVATGEDGRRAYFCDTAAPGFDPTTIIDEEDFSLASSSVGGAQVDLAPRRKILFGHPTPKDIAEVDEEHRKRSRRITRVLNRPLSTQLLPYGQGRTKDVLTPHIVGAGRVMDVHSSGQILVEMAIYNPTRAESRKFYKIGSGVEERRRILVWYSRNDSPEQWLILRRNSIVSAAGPWAAVIDADCRFFEIWHSDMEWPSR